MVFVLFFSFWIGTIELHELQQVMRKLGQNPTESDLIEMINSVDDNGDNEIDFDEFLILMKSRIGERDPEKELKDAFAVFDTDGSGSIDRKELKRLMKKLGQALTEAELDAMMEEVDTNGDGEISFEEFKAMMVSSNNRLGIEKERYLSRFMERSYPSTLIRENNADIVNCLGYLSSHLPVILMFNTNFSSLLNCRVSLSCRPLILGRRYTRLGTCCINF